VCALVRIGTDLHYCDLTLQPHLAHDQPSAHRVVAIHPLRLPDASRPARVFRNVVWDEYRFFNQCHFVDIAWAVGKHFPQLNRNTISASGQWLNNGSLSCMKALPFKRTRLVAENR